jgi:hypothetical protein
LPGWSSLRDDVADLYISLRRVWPYVDFDAKPVLTIDQVIASTNRVIAEAWPLPLAGEPKAQLSSRNNIQVLQSSIIRFQPITIDKSYGFSPDTRKPVNELKKLPCLLHLVPYRSQSQVFLNSFSDSGVRSFSSYSP